MQVKVTSKNADNIDGCQIQANHLFAASVSVPHLKIVSLLKQTPC